MEDIERIVEQKALEKVNSNENAVVEQKPTTFDSLQDNYLKKQVDSGKSISEIATDFVKASATSEIMKHQDGKYDGFHKELAQEQKETIKESFKQDKVEQQAKTLTAKQQKAEAFYVSFRPILEFDFSHLIHKLNKGENEPKTYKDRSYGIPLMVLMLTLFVFPYCVVSIILALLNGINSIFEAIATFGKVARTIATSIFILILLALIVYCAMYGIDYFFGTNILSKVKY